MFKTGLASVSFRNLPVGEIIKLTVKSGLSAIEWGSDVHAPKDDAGKLKRIKEQMDAAGIYTSSYGTYFRIGETTTDELSEYVSAANALGTKILRLWCGRKNYGDMTEKEQKAIIEESKKAAMIAERAGVVLCMECHNNSFTNCIDGAIHLMRDVDSEAFRMYWQPSPLFDEKTNIEYAEKISAYTYNIHVFNRSASGPFPLSQGISTWKKYLSCFDGSQHLLLEFMPDGSQGSLPREALALRQLIGCDACARIH